MIGGSSGELIRRLEEILKGHKYRAKRIAKELGEEEDAVRDKLNRLVEENVLTVKGLYYYLTQDVVEKEKKIKRIREETGEKEKKKRGRKPKAKEEGERVLKKRGRKPKKKEEGKKEEVLPSYEEKDISKYEETGKISI